jgi:hypothetical protein
MDSREPARDLGWHEYGPEMTETSSKNTRCLTFMRTPEQINITLKSTGVTFFGISGSAHQAIAAQGTVATEARLPDFCVKSLQMLCFRLLE